MVDSDLVKLSNLSWSCETLRLPHIFLISEVNSSHCCEGGLLRVVASKLASEMGKE